MSFRKGSREKFGNQRVTNGSYSFASKLEASVYTMLKARENSDEIQILQVQDHVYLTKARIHYIPDFKCMDKKTNEVFWVEAKGYANDRWPMKKKLWKFYGPGKLEIWKGTHLRPYLDEVVEVESDL